jgi:hypothetical protein
VVKPIDRFLIQVETVDELPGPVSAAIRQIQADQSILGIVVIPPQEYPIRRIGWLGDLAFGWRVTPQRTVVLGEYEVVIVDVDHTGSLDTTTIPLKAIIGFELATVLLYAYMQLTWIDGDQTRSAKIEFNAVDEHIIRCYLDQLRDLSSAHPQAMPLAQDANFAELPLKFRNYLRMALLPCERLLVVVHQPPIHRVEGWWHPFISPHRTIAITDQHVIVLEDDLRSHLQYTIITRFLPLRYVQSLTFETTPDAVWMRLSVGDLRTAQDIAIPLDAIAAETIEGALEDILRVLAV